MVSRNPMLKQFEKCINIHGKIIKCHKWINGEIKMVKYHNEKCQENIQFITRFFYLLSILSRFVK